MHPLLQPLLLLYAFLLPGALLTLAAGLDWPLPLRLLGGLALGLLMVPLISFCLAWGLSTSVSPAVVLGAATALNLSAGLGAWRARS